MDIRIEKVRTLDVIYDVQLIDDGDAHRSWLKSGVVSPCYIRY